MLKVSWLFGRLNLQPVTVPFTSAKVPQRPVLKGKVMPGSVSLLSKIVPAAFMLLINVLGGCVEDQGVLELF